MHVGVASADASPLSECGAFAAEEVCSCASTACPAQGYAQSASSCHAVEATPPAASSDLVPRPLTNDERLWAWRAANFDASSSRQERPVALWLLGPSSVGKSTLVGQLGPSFGIPALQGPGAHGLDAVLIDGEFIREFHGLWQRWIKTEDWRCAYPALKSVINGEKEQLRASATAMRKHLIIPHTLLNLHRGLTEMEELIRCGYTCHVVAVVAPLEECRRRGLKREVATGKRYQPLEFDLSISAIPAMAEACNGRFELLRAVELPSQSCGMNFPVVLAGDGGRCRASGEAAFDAEVIRNAVDGVIRPMEHQL